MTNLYAHKDRIERPIHFKFIFENQETLIFKNTDKLSLDSISKKIITGEKKIVLAILSFKTGEKMEFKYVESKLDHIKIIDNKKKLIVPKLTINKLQEIHFSSIALLWDGRNKKAFSANYFIIQFNISVKLNFGKYSYVQLSYSNMKFTNAIIWRQISINSKQWNYL